MIRYITLWEILMKRFYAELFVSMAIYTAKAINLNLAYSEEELNQLIDYDESSVKELAEKFKGFEKEFIELDMPMTAQTCGRFVDVLTNQKSTYLDFDVLAKQLEDRLHDELKLRKFFSIERNKEPFLLGEDLFGKSVSDAFPSAILDIQEAAKCIAFERWTAAVFHLSRVAEIAIVNIGKKVGYKSHKPGFGEVLNYMDSQLEKARKDSGNALPEFLSNMQFLSAVTVQMHAVNRAWRQRVAHLDTKYTEEEALRIWSAIKGLMEEIARPYN
jgi:hypothetical protein